MAAAQHLESNIVATVSTAEAVLSHFERSLVEAGFAEGAESYRRMSETLIGQRLWAESSGTASSAPFTAVGARARAIHALLLPYVEAFGRLAVLASPSLLQDSESGHGVAGSDAARAPSPRAAPPASREARPSGTPPEVEPVAAAVLGALDDADRPLSLTALRADLQISRAELLAAVERLSAGGVIQRRTASGRELISRSERG